MVYRGNPLRTGRRHPKVQPIGSIARAMGTFEAEGFGESEDMASCVEQVPLLDAPSSDQPTPETTLQKRVREHLDSFSEEQPLPAPKPYGDALGSLDIADEVFDETKEK